LIEDSTTKSAIIIENKINHTVNNDLDIYYKHIDLPNEKKTGVLLTITPYSVPKKTYVNITHKELVKEVQNYLSDKSLEENLRVYWSDFYNNIIQLTYKFEMNEQVKFYFGNAETIWKAKTNYETALKYVIDQLKIVADRMGPKWELKGESKKYRYLQHDDFGKDAMYTIYFEYLFHSSETHLPIIIELQDKGLKLEDKLKDMLKGDPLYEKMDLKGWRDKKSAHSMKLNYNDFKITEFDESEGKPSFASFIYDEIQTKMQPVMNKIHSYLEKA